MANPSTGRWIKQLRRFFPLPFCRNCLLKDLANLMRCESLLMFVDCGNALVDKAVCARITKVSPERTLCGPALIISISQCSLSSVCIYSLDRHLHTMHHCCWGLARERR